VVFSVEGEQESTQEIEGSHPLQLEGENAHDKQASDDTATTSPPQPEKAAQPETQTPEPTSRIPIRQSSRVASKPLINYRLLNNPNTRGPTEWRHHVPVEEDSCSIAVDYAFLAGSIEDDPMSVKEAKNRPDWAKWKVAMDDEIEQLRKLGTWTLVELPQGRVAIDNKWVYRLKRDIEGIIQKHKARLVAKGFEQIYGIDYGDTFAPVMRLDTLRLLLALATKLGLEIHVVDIVGAYLNGKLEEIIYMKQPPEYDDGTGRVCQLHRTLYGLKQSGRVWNEDLNGTFIKLQFTRLYSDQCVYIRHTSDALIIIAVHVDDMALFGSDSHAIATAKDELRKEYKLTDLGKAQQIVGLEIERDLDAGTLKISQTQYIRKILDRFGMADSHPVASPLDLSNKLKKTPDDERYDLPEYSAAIGSLMYAAIGTRPDIAFAVQTLSQFMSNPNPTHWAAVKRVFRYLNGTRTLGITYEAGGEFEPLAYSDSDWGSNPNDRKSISGMVFLSCEGPISWTSKKQPTVALSTMEAEYMATSLASRQALWLRNLTKELGIPYRGPTTFYVDNQSAIDYTNNSTNHGRAKHIDIKHHFVREKVISNEIEIHHCASEDNLADPFTKGLPRPQHEDLFARMGMASKLRGSVKNGSE
jgi:hypothetical protein